jgi:NADH-quinone oxidoreductase subunit N
MIHDAVMSFSQQCLWLKPSFFLAVMTLVVLMAEVFLKTKVRALPYLLSLITPIIGVILTWPLLSEPTSMGVWIMGDRTTASVLLTSWVLAFMCFAYAQGYLKSKHFPEGEFYTLMLCSLLGAQVLILSHHLLTFYLGLELMSLPLYALISIQRDGKLGPEAALKYFVMGAIASGVLLFGISLIYAVTKTMTLTGLMSALSHMPATLHPAAIPLWVGLVFVLIAAAFKLGLVPFHMWSPDVYEGAPLPVMVYLSTIPKMAMISALIHMILSNLPAESGQPSVVLTILMTLSVLSVLLGNLFAVVQTHLKRLFAYSTIGHIGLIGLALSVGALGERVAVFYVVIYAFMSVAGFGLLSLMSQGSRDVDVIDDLQGLAKRNGWMAFLFMLILLSMAGIPPFIGFIAKLRVLMLLVDTHHIGLAIFALIMSVIGAYYYIKIIKAMYFDTPLENAAPIVTGKTSLGHVVLGINCLAVLVLGCLPSLLAGWI